MIAMRNERLSDFEAREALLDRAYGPARFAKTSARVREGRLPAEDLSFVAINRRRVVGTVRLWNIAAGSGRSALLLGPLAVDPAHQGNGLGGRLMRHAIAAARMRGHGAILLVGDAAYYGRFGFCAETTGALRMPGPYEPHRLLALELVPGALAGARGLIGATGRPAPKFDIAAPRAAERKAVNKPTPRAA
jgi:predicted N-acetyltransferase YhbS